MLLCAFVVLAFSIVNLSFWGFFVFLFMVGLISTLGHSDGSLTDYQEGQRAQKTKSSFTDSDYNDDDSQLGIGASAAYKGVAITGTAITGAALASHDWTDDDDLGATDFSSDDTMSDINPATGLPMIGGMGGVDAAGNPFGTDLSSDLTSGTCGIDTGIGMDDCLSSSHDDFGTSSMDSTFDSGMDSSFDSGMDSSFDSGFNDDFSSSDW
jgi:hypothetical protein